MAKKKLFKTFYGRLLMKYAGSIAIDQDRPDKGVLKGIFKTLNDGNIVGIFPEGERSKTEKLLKGYNGVIKIALMTKTPIVCVGLNGFYEILPKGAKIPNPFKSKCIINIAEPIHFTQEVRNNLEEATRTVMKKIASLTGQEYDF